MNYTSTFDSPCGPLTCVVDDDGAVLRIAFGHGRDARKIAELKAENEAIEDASRTAEVRRQLAEYFAGRRQEFDLPLAPRGTPFQLAVWAELRRIPFGETRSYADVARALGKPAATRAVGRANGANPIPIVVPCHRVVGSDGSLTGFGGGLAAKARLLELEGRSLPFSS
ncbi:MAG TPA: methylated-DNA--[protein]-cysteine S-methyltransferase [Thermoanaerobaculia bacterium]|nr:methylated-DNA--[protein]-cysteine S-methyltransferase [Thermoanaerobaculia bacterium]